MLTLAIMAISVGTALAADPPKAQVADLSWLSGEWVELKDGIETTEQWLAPKGGIMLAVSRTITPKGTQFEYLRIEDRKTGIVFVAQPGGKPPTDFPLKTMTAQSVTFESDTNPFPKTITYKCLDHGRLTATIAGTINGKPASMSWTWTKK